MRWFWIDRFTEFESGRSATAVKTVTLSEDHLHDHFPGIPIMPNSLILEGMAQTGGLLVSQGHDFRHEVVLAKVTRATFHFPARPGDTLIYRATVENMKEDGALVSLTSHVEGRVQADVEIFFAYLVNGVDGRRLFEPEHLFSWLRMLRLFEVGHDADGRPLAASPQLPDQRTCDGERRGDGDSSVARTSVRAIAVSVRAD